MASELSPKVQSDLNEIFKNNPLSPELFTKAQYDVTAELIDRAKAAVFNIPSLRKRLENVDINKNFRERFVIGGFTYDAEYKLNDTMSCREERLDLRINYGSSIDTIVIRNWKYTDGRYNSGITFLEDGHAPFKDTIRNMEQAEKMITSIQALSA